MDSKSGQPQNRPLTPVVSVIVLSFRRPEKLRRCLSSLLRNSYPRTEIIVVDDASGDSTPSIILQEFPSVRLIVHDIPRLTAQSLLDGFKAATGEYIIMIDDDNVVAPDFISVIVGTFVDHAEVGVVGPLCYYLEAPTTIMYAGARLRPFTRMVEFIAQGLHEPSWPDRLVNVDMFPNCFAVRKRALPDHPILDPDRLPFFNDDACIQMAVSDQGFKVVLNPRAKIWHDHPRGEGDSRMFSAFRMYYFVRSKVFFERDCDSALGRSTYALSLPAYLAGYLAIIMRATISKSEKYSLVQVMIVALLHGLLGRTGRPYLA